MHYFLGLEVWQKAGEIFLSQGKYVVKLLERFGMVDCKSVATPMELNFKKLCGTAARPKLGNRRGLDVLSEISFRHKFCSEHIESIHSRASSHSLDWCQEFP